MDVEDSRTSTASEDDDEAAAEDGELSMQVALAEYAAELCERDARREPVWAEHSYCRARRSCGAGGGDGCGGRGRSPGNVSFRTLAAPSPPRPARCPHCRDEPAELLDPVGAADAPAPPDPLARLDEHDEPDDDDWEERLSRSATAPARRRLATAAAAVMRDLRLAELAGRGVPGARLAARAEAGRRLRRALAGGHADGAAAWLAGELSARRAGARVLEAMLLSAPTLAPRLGVAPPRDACRPVAEPARARHSRPTLVWLPSGSDRLDDRWERRFRLLFPVRRVRFHRPERCGPERWASLLLERARAAARAAPAGAVLAGAGAGAALALRLAAGGAGGARGAGGVLALGPPLLTAEDASPAPPPASGVPALLVVGERSERGGRAAAGVWAAGAGGGGRVLVVSGADHLLRGRARAGPPQVALDALVTSRAARWLLRLAERKEPAPAPLSPVLAEDIMRMPIVFADDAPEPARPGRGRRRTDLDLY